MTGKPLLSKNDLTASLQKLIAGLEQLFGGKTMLLHGQIVDSDTVVATFKAQIDALAASHRAHDEWLQAVATQRAAYAASVVPMIAAVRTYIAAAFGPRSAELVLCGFQPPKKPVKSPEAKVVGAEKLRATRKARNTMGRKQRLAIKGAVPATITVSTGTERSTD